MSRVTFEPAHQVVEFTGEPSLLEVARSAKIPVEASCGGNGTCGTCLVRVLEGLSRLPERNEIESEMAHDRSFPANERLACQTQLCGDLSVVVLFP